MMYAVVVIPISLYVHTVNTRNSNATVWGVPARAIQPFTTAAMVVSIVVQITLSIWGVRHARRRKRLIATGHVCTECLYDVSGVTGPICPECGKAITRPASAAAQTAESKPSPPPPDAPH
ncbi:MAG: hypothetical protein SFY95_12365 [Planctomycetota bacterium]|nr:hypothetical protein [Planctomycetota bacterium]